MKSTIVIVVALLVVVYGLAQVGTIYRAKRDLKTFVQHTLDFVDETTKESVKTDIVQAAQKLHVIVLAGNIDVVYEDDDALTISKSSGTQLANKRVVISLRYVASVMGLPVHQQITASKFRQVTTGQSAKTE